MDAEFKNKFSEYLTCIEEAIEHGLTPTELTRIIRAGKTKPNLKVWVASDLFTYIKNKKYKSPRAAIKAYIKSKGFKERLKMDKSKTMQRKLKSFFPKQETNLYMTKSLKTLVKDMTPSEHKRYKFVESIYQDIKKSKTKAAIKAVGIGSLFLSKLPKRK